MNGKINLCIITKERIFCIPFATIRQLDMFTVRYNNKMELIDSLIRILRLPIEIEEVEDLNMQYVYTDKKLPIKYSSDNYDPESVVSAYIYYLQKDQKRLDDYGIRNVVRIVEPDYKNKIFSDYYVALLAKRYLKEDYRKIRDVYFLLKNHMIIKINEIKPRKKRNKIVPTNENDDYIESLISCFNRSEEEYMMALEELSMMDLEELEMKLSSYNMHIIDGVQSSEYDECDMDDIKELVRLTGLDIECLRYIATHEDGYKKKR